MNKDLNSIKKPFFFRIKNKDRIFFSRNLALLLKSGISLSESLVILKESSESKSLKFLINNIISDVDKGQFLYNSLAKFSKQLGNFFISLIRIGEVSGKLVENCDKLAIELEKADRLKSKIINAMIYPAFIIGIMFVIIIIIIYFLFPRLLPMFESLNIELPLMTRIFFQVSTFILNYGLYLLIAMIAMVILMIFLVKKFYKIRYGFHIFILHLPILGKIVKKFNLASLCRTFGLLLNSGMPIVEALQLTSETLSNEVFKKSILRASEFIAQGHPLEEFLNTNTSLFPYNFIKMINIGEKTGNLSNTLNYLTQNYEQEIEIEIDRLLHMLEPIILFTIAAIVGFMAIAIITPIYEISDKISQ
ncbi:MAG: phytochrome sensor protein [Candidatus Parcubacteria bacterium]|nr:MAG: phytochrome sensor protein [Candidatus Parcubacteria bacterium]